MSQRTRKCSRTPSPSISNLRRRPRRLPRTVRCFLVCPNLVSINYSGSIHFLELRQDPFRRERGSSEASQGVTRPHHVLRRRSPSSPASGVDKMKVRMSMSLLSLLVYTVGVKCRGINKKEHYAPEHMFSLSENTANKMFRRDGMIDLIKHNRTHLVRVYPKGTRVSSTNFVPQQYWSAGIQLVALNWQTYGGSSSNYEKRSINHRLDLGYMINHAMFQRNGRSGYVLKPLALRSPDKSLLNKQTRHHLDITVCVNYPCPRTLIDID